MKTKKLALNALKVSSFTTASAADEQVRGGNSMTHNDQPSYIMPNGRPICYYTEGGYACN